MNLGFAEIDAARAAYGRPVEPEPELVARLMRQMVDSHAKSPLLQEFMRQNLALGMATGSPVGRTTKTAFQVLGEIWMHALTLCIEEQAWRGDEGLLKPAERLRIAMQLHMATPYLWLEAVHSAAVAAEVPRHVISRSVLPGPFLWFTYERGAEAVYDRTNGDRDYPEGDFTIDGTLLCDGIEGINSAQIGSLWHDVERDPVGSAQPWITGAGIPYGKTYPDDFEGVEREGVRQLLALFAFLNSPYLPKSTLRLSRPERRRVMRHRPDDPIPDVTFVDLRRVQAPNIKSTEHGSVDWKHRWLVGGHLRAQWYPSEQAHHVIYIAPYLKGPPDAPMKETAYRVRR